MTGSSARVVFTRRARTVGDSVRTTFGREKNTEAHGKRLQRLHTLLYGFVLSGRSGARAKTHDLLKTLDLYLKTKVSIPRIRMGQQQEIETLVNEEALLFAQYLRNEKQTWTPRIVSV